jgi:two-component system, chemotaxis family, protein-glutamate methylesterase/glutaminase
LTQRDFIAVGASLGGVDALRFLVSGLPPDLPATVAIVQHVGAHESILPSILSASGPLAAVHATDGERYRHGKIYVAPPDRHLVVEGAVLRLLHSAKENFARPAIDPLFRSAAVELGARSVGVILTGQLDDGAAGLEAIQACGGSTLVQYPADAFAREMPENASRFADDMLPLKLMASRLVELTGRASAARPRPANPRGNPAANPGGDTDDAAHEAARQQVAIEQLAWRGDRVPPAALSQIAVPSTFTCPECSGTLWRVSDSGLVRYRCHTGHAYSLKSLSAGRRDDVERSLLDAVRALRERELTSLALGEHFGNQGNTAAQSAEEDIARRANEAAELLQSILLER